MKTCKITKLTVLPKSNTVTELVLEDRVPVVGDLLHICGLDYQIKQLLNDGCILATTVIAEEYGDSEIAYRVLPDYVKTHIDGNRIGEVFFVYADEVQETTNVFRGSTIPGWYMQYKYVPNAMKHTLCNCGIELLYATSQNKPEVVPAKDIAPVIIKPSKTSNSANKSQ